jgi:hypothetical protein
MLGISYSTQNLQKKNKGTVSDICYARNSENALFKGGEGPRESILLAINKFFNELIV